MPKLVFYSEFHFSAQVMCGVVPAGRGLEDGTL